MHFLTDTIWSVVCISLQKYFPTFLQNCSVFSSFSFSLTFDQLFCAFLRWTPQHDPVTTMFSLDDDMFRVMCSVCFLLHVPLSRQAIKVTFVLSRLYNLQRNDLVMVWSSSVFPEGQNYEVDDESSAWS